MSVGLWADYTYRELRLNGRAGASVFPIGGPDGRGGTATGANPYELLSASLAACAHSQGSTAEAAPAPTPPTIIFKVSRRECVIEGHDRGQHGPAPPG
mgnify:CR=1 FL=1